MPPGPIPSRDPTRRGPALLLILLFLAIAAAAHAAKDEFERIKIHVNVAGIVEDLLIADVLSFELRAEVQAGGWGSSHSGGVQILLGDGSVRVFTPVGATLPAAIDSTQETLRPIKRQQVADHSTAGSAGGG